MNPPDLTALLKGDPDAWDQAFAWLWPTAHAVARLKLEPFLPEDIEDVAIEALEALVDKVKGLQSVAEMKPLTASIAHHRAVSHLRERFAKKRGEGKTQSLDALVADGENPLDAPDTLSPLAGMEQAELAGLLRELQTDLKPEQRTMLNDFFIHRLSYEEIAQKHGLAVGTVGVYLKRGLEAMHAAGARRPGVLKELEVFLR